jgi:leader peptidase (prepilin peptidase) / N-methyltransferase
MIADAPVVITLFLFGACVGSFINVVALRFSTKEDAITQRSHCPACGHQLRWYELVPLFSFLLLRGQCSACQAQIAVRYPLVEFVLGVAALALFWPLPPDVLTVAALILSFIAVCLLIILFLIDLRTFLLPDTYIVALLLVAGVRYMLVQPFSVMQALVGMSIDSGLLFLLWAGTRGRGIGLGDVKLMVPLGLLFGPFHVVVLLFGAFITGGAYGTYLLATGKATPKTAVPFGPYLTGAAVVLLIKPELADRFIQFFLPGMW